MQVFEKERPAPWVKTYPFWDYDEHFWCARFCDNLGMTDIREAMEFLQQQGHEVGRGSQIIRGELHVPIDGQLRSAREIWAAVTPEDKDVWGFEVLGKQYQLHYFFPYGGNVFELYENGKVVGQRQATDEGSFALAQRLCTEMGGENSLQRIA